MRFARRDVRDHIASQKNDHGASYPLLQSIATMESSKHQRLRDFWRRSIFDFCNTIGTFRTCRGGLTTSALGGRTDMPFKQDHFRAAIRSLMAASNWLAEGANINPVSS
jgi:hypothetical protein